LKQYFKESSAHGLEVTLAPDLEYVQNDELVKLTKTQFDELGELMAKFIPECDNELLKEMDRYLKVNMGEKKIEDIKVKDDFKIADMVFKSSKLKKLAEAVKRKRIELYISFNIIFLDLMPYIEIGKKLKAGSISDNFYKVKDLILFSIKSNFIQS
jgi:5,10-methylenetetrahydrofolate reductase